MPERGAGDGTAKRMRALRWSALPMLPALCSLEAESFITKCPCLKRNTECDATCACEGNGGSDGQASAARQGGALCECAAGRGMG